ncbi:hypothetical protein ACHHV8_10840 [Paenibacillus sp. TAB 01]|uniref:hypothetical protein n=1 Tax=Paenibacillus sp. TAB 01 TaxID=3368988 RepID=UPI0037522158
MQSKNSGTTVMAIIIIVLCLFGILLRSCRESEKENREKELINNFKKYNIESMLFDEEDIAKKMKTEYNIIFAKNKEPNPDTYVAEIRKGTSVLLHAYDEDYHKDNFAHKVASVAILSEPEYLASPEGIQLTMQLLKALNKSLTENEIKETSLKFFEKVKGKKCVYGEESLKEIEYERSCGSKGLDMTALRIKVLEENVVKLAREAEAINKKKEQ